MPDQIAEEVKTMRSNELLELEGMQSKAFRENFIGKSVKVLLEEEKEFDGRLYWLGHTGEYVKVAVPSGEYVKNMFIDAEIKAFLTEDILLGASGTFF